MTLVTRETIKRDSQASDHLVESGIRKVLVVGGSGFIASALLNYLNNINCKTVNKIRVKVLSRSTLLRNEYSSQFEFQHHPHHQAMEDCYREFLPDVVYFISRISSPVAEIGALEENLNFLRSHINMITSITSIPKLVYLSSGAVYGRTEVDQNNSPFSESQRIDLGCLSDYARIKAESENLIETSFGSSSANYVLARLFAFYGPGLPLNDFAIGNFMASKIRKEPIQIKGDGRTVRSYMHVDDLSATLCRLATDGTGALNVGGRYPITLLELSELYKKLFGCPIEVLEQEDFESYYVPNISKIEKLLDKTNFISLEEGLQSWNKELEI